MVMQKLKDILDSLHCWNVMNNLFYISLDRKLLYDVDGRFTVLLFKSARANKSDIYSLHWCYDLFTEQNLDYTCVQLVSTLKSTQVFKLILPRHPLSGLQRCTPRIPLMKNWPCTKSGAAQGKFTQLAKVITWWGATFLFKYTCGQSSLFQSCSLLIQWGSTFSIIQPFSKPVATEVAHNDIACTRPWCPDLLNSLAAGVCVFFPDLGHPVVLIYLCSLWHRGPYSKEPKIIVYCSSWFCCKHKLVEERTRGSKLQLKIQ